MWCEVCESMRDQEGEGEKMKKQYYYTIMEGNKFLASNLMRGMVDNIVEAVKLYTENDAIKYLIWRGNFRIVEVECILREYEV